jgi:hypothetical protein
VPAPINPTLITNLLSSVEPAEGRIGFITDHFQLNDVARAHPIHDSHGKRNVADKRTKTGKKMELPISFDKDAALQAAILLCQGRGYEGTSMADLTQATALGPSSICGLR